MGKLSVYSGWPSVSSHKSRQEGQRERDLTKLIAGFEEKKRARSQEEV